MTLLDIVKESEGRRRKTKQKRRGGSSIAQRKQEEQTTNPNYSHTNQYTGWKRKAKLTPTDCVKGATIL